MPRYFFDFDGEIDAVGLEFEDLEKACAEARRAMPDLAKEEMAKQDDKRKEHWTCGVRDEAGVTALRLTFQLLTESRKNGGSPR